jgi:hypothetical protein
VDNWDARAASKEAERKQWVFDGILDPSAFASDFLSLSGGGVV